MAKKITLVTGTGRSGTSAFMRFLRSAGKVGASNDNEVNNEASYWNDEVNAGFELPIHTDVTFTPELVSSLPNVVKDPRLMLGIGSLVEHNRRTIEIEHIFLMTRDWNKSARSREDNDLNFFDYNGVTGDGESEREKHIDFFSKCYVQFWKDVCRHELPVTQIMFPLFVKNPLYLYRSLWGTPMEMRYNDVVKHHKLTMKPKLVHY